MTATPPAPARRLPQLDWEILGLILAWKVGVFVVIFVANALVPFRGSGPAAIGPHNPSVWSAFRVWDSDSYIFLAEKGYGPDEIRNAFAPLYPFAIRALNFISGDSIASGLLISNLASLAGLYLFAVFAGRQFGRDVALRALVLFLAFPTAFYLNLIYTEGLFLLLAMLFFIALYRKAYPWAALAAFLLTLARPQGVMIIVPFALFIFLDALKTQEAAREQWNAAGIMKAIGPRALYVLAPVLAVVLYFAYMESATGDALAAVHAQDRFISERSASNLLKPWIAIEHMLTPDLSVHEFTTSVIDRLFFWGFIASWPVVYRHTDKVLFSFYALMGLEPLLGSYMSYTRYVMLAFPLYVAYAAWSTKVNLSPYAVSAALFPMMALQGLFIALHTSNYWVA
jgi:hypothetical protein